MVMCSANVPRPHYVQALHNNIRRVLVILVPLTFLAFTIQCVKKKLTFPFSTLQVLVPFAYACVIVMYAVSVPFSYVSVLHFRVALCVLACARAVLNFCFA